MPVIAEEICEKISRRISMLDLVRRKKSWVRGSGENSAVRAPSPTVVLNRFGIAASGANRQRGGIDFYRCVSLNNQVIHAPDAPADKTILIQVRQEWIEPRVFRQDDALGIARRLERPAKLAGNVEVKCVLAAALDPLEFNSPKMMRCRGLAGRLRRILLRADVDDRLVALIQQGKINLVDVFEIHK